jgi:hypothetical protein
VTTALARKPPPARMKGPQRSLPEELARHAIAHEEEAPGGKVRMTFRVVLSRSQAEALAAQAIREEKNLVALVTEILEAAPTKTHGRD